MPTTPTSAADTGVARIRLPDGIGQQKADITTQGEQPGVGNVENAQQAVDQGEAHRNGGIHNSRK